MDPGGTGLVSSWEKTPERILFCAMWGSSGKKIIYKNTLRPKSSQAATMHLGFPASWIIRKWIQSTQTILRLGFAVYPRVTCNSRCCLGWSCSHFASASWRLWCRAWTITYSYLHIKCILISYIICQYHNAICVTSHCVSSTYVYVLIGNIIII
jgi:hypothetical protein